MSGLAGSAGLRDVVSRFAQMNRAEQTVTNAATAAWTYLSTRSPGVRPVMRAHLADYAAALGVSGFLFHRVAVRVSGSNVVVRARPVRGRLTQPCPVVEFARGGDAR